MSLQVTHCDPTDGPAMGSLETSTMTRLLQLRLGTATPESLKVRLAQRYSKLIPDANAEQIEYLKVVAPIANDNMDEVEMVAFAEWVLPDNDDALEADDETTESYDDMLEEDANTEGAPPPGMNRAFSRYACACVTEMRSRVLRGRKCFCEYISRYAHPEPRNEVLTNQQRSLSCPY